MQNKDRYQLHVRPRQAGTWDVRRVASAASPPPRVARSADTASSRVKQPPKSQVHYEVAARSRRKPRLSLKRFSVLASLVLGVGLATFVGIDIWSAGSPTTGGAVMGASVGTRVKNAEGSDETPISPTTIDNYQVTAGMPRFLEIAKLGIKARILPMGVNSDNSIQAPVNTNDSGWYSGSARPGAPGASFIDGHASGATRLGLFGNLDRLVAGDQVKVEMGSGTVYTYAVVKVEVVPLDEVSMTRVLSPVSGSDRGLNLMTCSGVYAPKTGSFDKRVIVYTKEITS